MGGYNFERTEYSKKAQCGSFDDMINKDVGNDMQ